MRGWSIWSFDVTTAFLSGEATSREIYVKICEGTLGGIACSEGASSSRGRHPFPDSQVSPWSDRSTKIARWLSCPWHAQHLQRKKPGLYTWAILCLHVEDGLLMGEEADPRFVKLKKSFDTLFTIKTWQQVPMTFLGVGMEGEGSLLTDTMENYMKNIRIPELMAKEPGAVLMGGAKSH